jgi:hypothetical protein
VNLDPFMMNMLIRFGRVGPPAADFARNAEFANENIVDSLKRSHFLKGKSIFFDIHLVSAIF